MTPLPDCRPWLAELVAFDTTSRHSNLNLIHHIQAYFDRFGLQSWLTYHADGTKANLFATLPAADGSTQGGLVLSGHTDTVPVDGQNWTSDPFTLSEREGRLYGRGTCDMKGFIAAALALLPEWAEQSRRKPLHFALSYDEEIGCAGAPAMIEQIHQHGLQPEGCIVGEPTGMDVVVAHKGINVFDCRIHGRAAHSSLTPHGCNAIEYAAQLICHIRHTADRYRSQGPFDHAYDVPFTTLTTNLIEGGIAVNTIPADCRFQYEFRNLPGLSATDIQEDIQHYVHTQLLPAMRRECPEAAIEITRLAAAPSLEACEQAAFTALVRTLNANRPDRKVAYGTEAGLFQQIGIPTIVCGPGHIAQAHKADEFVATDQLNDCMRFLRRLVAA